MLFDIDKTIYVPTYYVNNQGPCYISTSTINRTITEYRIVECSIKTDSITYTLEPLGCLNKPLKTMTESELTNLGASYDKAEAEKAMEDMYPKLLSEYTALQKKILNDAIISLMKEKTL